MATVRKDCLLLMLSLFACAAFAATPAEQFVAPYLYQGESVSDITSMQLQVPEGNFVLVKVRGTEAFLLAEGQNGTGYSFVNSTDSIYSVLRDYYWETTYPSVADMEFIDGRLYAFNSSRYPRELECKTSVGLDRPGATCEADRCESCMTVPFCGEKMPYFGPDFPDAIHDLLVSTDAMDSAIANASNALNAIEEGNADPSVYAAFASGNITSLMASAQGLSSNHLFGCYELSGSQLAPIGLEWCAYRSTARLESQWCKEIPLNTSLLTDALTRLTAVQGRIVSNATSLSKAQTVYAATNARVNSQRLREENETFQEFYSQVEARASSASRHAGLALANVTDQNLSSEVALLSELMLRLSQYGLDRNFTAANATAEQVYALSAKIDGDAANLSEKFAAFSALNDSTTLTLFIAGLYIDSGDKALQARLGGLYQEKDQIDGGVAAGGALSQDALAEYSSDLSFIRQEAGDIVVAKQGQNSKQAGTLLAGFVQSASVGLVNLASAAVPMGAETREHYARTLPTVVTAVAALLFYLGCVAVFASLYLRRRIRLNRISLVLWLAIFLFLLVLVAMVTVTINSVIQNETSRSAFGLFSAKLSNAESAVVVVDETLAPPASYPLMEACGEQFAGSLSGRGTQVKLLTYSGGACTLADGTAAEPEECTDKFGGVPAVTLSYAPGVNMTFYAYYAPVATIQGNDDFYSRCLISRAFEVTG
jgi:hypothetical protein